MKEHEVCEESGTHLLCRFSTKQYLALNTLLSSAIIGDDCWEE